MPIYEYKCQKCGEHFEVNQPITGKPLKKHNNEAKCGGKVEKLISSSAFHLKGGGWYKTDYAKPSATAGSSKKEEGSAAASTTTESKKESAPEPAKKETATAAKD